MNANQEAQPLKTDGPRPESPQPVPPTLTFQALAQGAKEVLIDHNSQLYRLRVTKNGKLILNK